MRTIGFAVVSDAARSSLLAILLLAVAGCNNDALMIDGSNGGTNGDGANDRHSDLGLDGLAGPGSDLYGTCVASLTFCGMSCTDTISDAKNCGGCGKACGAKEACLKGACGPCPIAALFAAPVIYGEPNGHPVFVDVGDLRGNGMLDLLSLVPQKNGQNPGEFSVGILLNQGTGNFTERQGLQPSGKAPTSLALGDFNLDGRLDYVVANSGGNSIWVCLQDSNLGFCGNMDLGSALLPGLAPSSVVTSDFNADGALDVAVANAGDGNVTILINNYLNKGLGKLAIAGKYPTGMGPHSVVSGDWNADGKPDLAVANLGDNNVAVLVNTGAGAFAAAVHYKVGAGAWSVAAGDFDGDGKLDLAVANQTDNSVSVLLNKGGGMFGAAMNYPAGKAPQGVAVGDFDGDGKNDLAVADTMGGVALLLNQGGGAFAQPALFDAGGNTSSIVAADLNGDGKPDLAVTLPDKNAVAVLLNRAGECQ